MKSRNPQTKLILIPDGWYPSDKILNYLQREVELTHYTLKKLADKFIDYNKKRGKRFASIDNAYINFVKYWVRNGFYF